MSLSRRWQSRQCDGLGNMRPHVQPGIFLRSELQSGKLTINQSLVLTEYRALNRSILSELFHSSSLVVVHRLSILIAWTLIAWTLIAWTRTTHWQVAWCGWLPGALDKRLWYLAISLTPSNELFDFLIHFMILSKE